MFSAVFLCTEQAGDLEGLEMAGLGQNLKGRSNNAMISLPSTSARDSSVPRKNVGNLSSTAVAFSLPLMQTNHPLLSALGYLLLLLLATVFHGCHVGGHDDDLLRAAYPNVCSWHR